jgi:hypothetical protein
LKDFRQGCFAGADVATDTNDKIRFLMCLGLRDYPFAFSTLEITNLCGIFWNCIFQP